MSLANEFFKGEYARLQKPKQLEYIHLMFKADNLKLALLIISFWALCLLLGNMFQRYKLLNDDQKHSAQAILSVVLPQKVIAIDTNPPKVLGIASEPVITSSTTVKIAVNEPLDLATLNTGAAQLVESNSERYVYKLDLNDLKEGVNEYSLTLKDESGNTNNHHFKIIRLGIEECIARNNGVVKAVPFPNALDALVDKFNKLSENYIPYELTNGAKLGLPVIGSAYLRFIAYDPLKNMITDIRNAGINVTISSGWRSFAHQQRVYNYWVGQVGPEKANEYAALPGFSEHHLGTAFDLLTSENNFNVSTDYENTRLSRWLRENAFRYGFVMSYPKGAEKITGYSYEPWHWRYVGVDHSLKLHELGITLTEYLYALNNIKCD